MQISAWHRDTTWLRNTRNTVRGNRRISEIHPTMHLSHIPQCTIQNRNVHISVLDGAVWDMEQVRCGICEFGLLPWIIFTWTYGDWWRHDMEPFSALLAICEGNLPVDFRHKVLNFGRCFFCVWLTLTVTILIKTDYMDIRYNTSITMIITAPRKE